MAERDAVLRAGVQGVQEVVVYSLNKVLLHEMPEEEEARERFVTYCLAVKSFLELHVTNQDTIFGHLHASGDFAMDEFLAQRPPVDEVREMLRRIETVGKDGVSHVELFRPLADVLLPEVARVDAFFEKLDFNRVSKEAEKSNRGDPNASLTVPLLFWTLSERNYDLMIKKSIPWPLRCLLCSYLFWAKAKLIVEFVPHYRSNWHL